MFQFDILQITPSYKLGGAQIYKYWPEQPYMVLADPGATS